MGSCLNTNWVTSSTQYKHGQNHSHSECVHTLNTLCSVDSKLSLCMAYQNIEAVYIATDKAFFSPEKC